MVAILLEKHGHAGLGDPADIADGDVVWLIGGETNDVEALIDVLEDSVDDT